MAQDLKMRFEVEAVENHTVTKRMGRRAPEGTKGLVFTDEKTVVAAGWHVYFPSGHSLFIDNEKEMIRLGFLKAPDVVDMETGEVVPEEHTMSPKQMVQRATQHRRNM